MTAYGIYLHIPYCHSKCPYCDFNVYALKDPPEERYTAALIAEWNYWKETSLWNERKLSSIFFGGGTPSFFSTHSLGRIIEAIARDATFNEDIEICLEVNPQDCTDSYATGLKAAGFNRVSIGAQSFSKRVLKELGRRHTPEDIVKAVSACRTSGIENVSVDIIFGIQEQTLDELKADIAIALGLDLPHLSTYQLTVESGTPFYQRQKQGKLILPPEDSVIAMMSFLSGTLTESGYQHYEISNFAKRGFRSLHNSGYWTGRNYLGLGAGAHSFCRYEHEGEVQYLRHASTARPATYFEQIEKEGHAVAWQEKPDLASQMAEHIMLGLRIQEGISLERFKSLFGYSLLECYEQELNQLLEKNLVVLSNTGYLMLTANGRLLADSITGYFVDPDFPGKPGSRQKGQSPSEEQRKTKGI